MGDPLRSSDSPSFRKTLNSLKSSSSLLMNATNMFSGFYMLIFVFSSSIYLYFGIFLTFSCWALRFEFQQNSSMATTIAMASPHKRTTNTPPVIVFFPTERVRTKSVSRRSVDDPPANQVKVERDEMKREKDEIEREQTDRQ